MAIGNITSVCPAHIKQAIVTDWMLLTELKRHRLTIWIPSHVNLPDKFQVY